MIDLFTKPISFTLMNVMEDESLLSMWICGITKIQYCTSLLLQENDRRNSLHPEDHATAVLKPTQQKSNKMVLCRVLLLDGNDFETEISVSGSNLIFESCFPQTNIKS